MPVNAAIVGLGWWGRVLVESVRNPASRLRFTRAVVREGGSGEWAARELGLPAVGSLEAMLDDPTVEAVVLATPHKQHVDQIVAAASAGKHVFTEKPLSLELNEAARAIDAVKRSGKVLGIGTDKRFLQSAIALARMISEGALGELLHLEGQYSNNFSSLGVSGGWRDREAEAPGAGMPGPGLHILDSLISLAGPVEWVDAVENRHKSPPQPIDSVCVLMKFRAGASGAMSTVRAVPDFFRLHVLGTRGWVELRGFGELTHHLNGGEPTSESHPPDLAVGYLLERFAGAVRGEETFPVSTDSMLDVVAAFEAVIRSLNTKARCEVRVPGKELAS